MHEDVGVAHAPGVGTAEVHWVRGVEAVHGVPGEHDGDAGGSELLLEGLCGIARDAGAEQKDGTLGGADAGDEVGEDGFGDGFEVRGEGGDGGVESGGVDTGALDVEGDFEEDGAFAAVGAGVGKLGEGGAVDDVVDELGALGDGLCDGDAVDFLDAALADLGADGGVGEVGDLDLAADHEELAGFEEGSAKRGDDVGEARSGGDECEGLGGFFGREVDFVEVLGGDAGGDLVDDGDAGELVRAGLKQVHEFSGGDEEAVGVAEGDEPVGEEVGVLVMVGRRFLVEREGIGLLRASQ